MLADPIDAFWPDRMDAFEGKPIRSVTQGAADLAKIPPIGGAGGRGGRRHRPAGGAEGGAGRRGGRGAGHRPAGRQRGGAGGRHGGAGSADAAPAAPGRAGRFAAPPVLEINPRHTLVAGLAAKAAEGEDVAEAAGLLFDLARIQDGDLPRDPAGFARSVEAALAGG